MQTLGLPLEWLTVLPGGGGYVHTFWQSLRKYTQHLEPGFKIVYK